MTVTAVTIGETGTGTMIGGVAAVAIGIGIGTVETTGAGHTTEMGDAIAVAAVMPAGGDERVWW